MKHTFWTQLWKLSCLYSPSLIGKCKRGGTIKSEAGWLYVGECGGCKRYCWRTGNDFDPCLLPACIFKCCSFLSLFPLLPAPTTIPPCSFPKSPPPLLHTTAHPPVCKLLAHPTLPLSISWSLTARDWCTGDVLGCLWHWLSRSFSHVGLWPQRVLISSMLLRDVAVMTVKVWYHLLFQHVLLTATAEGVECKQHHPN